MLEILQLSNLTRNIYESSAIVSYQFVISMMLCSLGFLAAQILFGLAVYNDAKAKCNTESLMWALLVSFLGLIPGIIYLCVRNSHWNRLILCRNCGIGHRISDLNCPQCGTQNPFSQQFVNPIAVQQQRTAKNFFIAATIILSLALIFMVISITGFITSVIFNGEGLAY